MNVIIKEVEKTAESFGNLVKLLIRFAQEHEMGKLSAKNFNFEKGVRWIANCVECAAWVVETESGEMIGSIGLYLTSPWYSDEPYYADGWLYVVPEYRDSKIAGMLLEKAKAFAEAQNKPLVIGIFSTQDTERKLQMLQRRGFKLIGGTLLFGE